MYTRVILQQVDLDTCLTGLLLGVGTSDHVTVARDGATPAELAAPDVLCIEAGGSGEAERNNFDHHDRGGTWPPACVQAPRIAGSGGSPAMERPVAYVTEVDLGRGAGERHPDGERPGLSGVVSGMRLTVADPKEHLFEGMRLLRTVVREDLDPSVPDACRCWKRYTAGKRSVPSPATLPFMTGVLGSAYRRGVNAPPESGAVRIRRPRMKRHRTHKLPEDETLHVTSLSAAVLIAESPLATNASGTVSWSNRRCPPSP